ncbi:MAG: methylmalonyl-CoA mutase family protein [Burkholderiaceae bacterium]|jgi:methylmalonyl-CoA mutase N-terminal domain/subunit|nr:methylmalonyl-CoA mutase family protein [Burkholderiaceae bacterium]
MNRPSEFSPYEDWKRRHEAALRGGWRQGFSTSSGFEVKPLYTATDLGELHFDYERDVGYPGQAPYTRGFTPPGYRAKLWKMEMYAGFGSAEDANKRYRYLIEQGSTGGVSIALDLPTQVGYDSDHPMARDEVGQIGVALTSLDDIERVFDGIPLDKAGHVFSTANCIGPIFCAWLLALTEKRGNRTADFTVQIQNDPIKEYVARGTQFLPIEASVRLATDVIAYCTQHAPEWLPISVSGSHMKQAGATTVQEAAFTVCNGIAYVETCLAKGMKIDDFGHRIELHFCTEMDFFEEVAKYRALRKVWTKLVRERFGGTTERAQHFRLHAATSGRPLTAQQPLNNISRITLQALAQILGGCEQTRTASFDEALGIPTEEAARTSIRANQIIGYETGIPYTVDPLGGSYYVEHLTLQFERRIWEIIDGVDRMGGALVAVKNGYFSRALAQGAYREQCAVESGEQVIVGVNRFQSDEPRPTPVFKLDPTAAERQIAKLQAVRARRDGAAVQAALAQLGADCASERNVMPAVLRCVKAYATVGEICQVWREVFGEYVPEAMRF